MRLHSLMNHLGLSATVASLTMLTGVALTSTTAGAVSTGSFDCSSASGIRSFQSVTFRGCDGDTGGRSESIDLAAGDGWIHWTNGKKTFVEGANYGPAVGIPAGHSCPSHVGGSLTATVVADRTHSLKVPGTLTMVVCTNRDHLNPRATFIKFT